MKRKGNINWSKICRRNRPENVSSQIANSVGRFANLPFFQVLWLGEGGAVMAPVGLALQWQLQNAQCTKQLARLESVAGEITRNIKVHVSRKIIKFRCILTAKNRDFVKWVSFSELSNAKTLSFWPIFCRSFVKYSTVIILPFQSRHVPRQIFCFVPVQ
jgi:hypothetical protein